MFEFVSGRIRTFSRINRTKTWCLMRADCCATTHSGTDAVDSTKWGISCHFQREVVHEAHGSLFYYLNTEVRRAMFRKRIISCCSKKKNAIILTAVPSFLIVYWIKKFRFKWSCLFFYGEKCSHVTGAPRRHTSGCLQRSVSHYLRLCPGLHISSSLLLSDSVWELCPAAEQ